jgi:hypothetical protein
MSKHTPGPWEVDEPGTIYVGGWEGPYRIEMGADHEADARLIAAAPDMLRVLEDVARWVGGMCSCRADDEYHDSLLAVIKKAKGE